MDASFDPNDIDSLRRRISELEAAKEISTGGGAVVRGSVEVSHGHFIGRDFVQVINNVVGNGEDAAEAQHVIAVYLSVLATDLAGLKLGAVDAASVDQSRQTPLQLADIYVPLDTTAVIPAKTALREWLTQAHTSELTWGEKARSVSALEALAEHRELTLIGKPGSGKSTFGASVLLALAQVWQGHDQELVRLGSTWRHGALLPIRVVLRRFAEQLPLGNAPASARDLWVFIGKELDEGCYGLSAQAAKYLQRMVHRHGALILLDGLDECGDATRRSRVQAAVRELMKNAGPASRFVLTARPYAWQGSIDTQRGVYELADLNAAQIEQFIRAWYAAVARHGWRPRADAERKAADLLQARQRADLQPLARNPLLLTLMATLHTNRGRLPDDRVDLYNESVELLLSHWNRQIGADQALLERLAMPTLKLADLREVLEELAFKVHEQNAGSEGTADIGEDQLVRAFSALLKSKDKADVVVDYIEKRAGLLLGQGERDGERRFTFPHRTFQEFLAARHLAASAELEVECVRLARTAPAHWQVVLPLAARLAGTGRGCSAADELIGGAEVGSQLAPLPADWTCAVLAGTQLLEIGVGAIQKSARTQAIAKRVADWLVAALPVHPQRGGLPAAQRAQAGRVLAQLGDPRFDVHRWYLPADDMLGFVRIAADPQFRIGTPRNSVMQMRQLMGFDDNQINDELTPAPDFYIGRYPVTVAQFRTFVATTHFELKDVDALQGLPSRPVTRVNWHEAAAYGRWLNEALARSSKFAVHPMAVLVRECGWTVSLPSELEWEVAARGGLRDQPYSWAGGPDPEQANYDDSRIHEPSVVGCFAANGFGLHDMLGNVWEWTRSQFAPYPYHEGCETLASGTALMVLRGGSFRGDAGDARCAYRYGVHPDYRRYNFGFRVVLRGPPVS